MNNVWIKSKSVMEARNKANAIGKKYGHRPTIYHFLKEDTYCFCVTEHVQKEAGL